MKIVLFSDGTGNSSAKAQKTNVWRMFEALEQNRADIRVRYDDGVGTSANRYLAMIGGAFGWGLKRNVLDLYKFVCANYQPGADIYGFGFSRGAYTIRVLTDLITHEGLVTSRSGQELDSNAAAVYRHYRAVCFRSASPIIWGMRWLRDLALNAFGRLAGHPSYAEIGRQKGPFERENVQGCKDTGIPIRFLGLWDSVDAYGMPVRELKRGIDWLIWPLMFDNLKLSPLVQRACHALALDDERKTFHPLVWDEVEEVRLAERKQVRRGRITQVWFAGVHSNVGGGYPEDKLALVSLAWMMNQAQDNGLPLDRTHVQRVNAEKSKYGRLYDSRAGLAAYYRYAPREIPVPSCDGKEILPVVHYSVIMRMVHGSDSYAPITLPARFWVLGPDGELLPMEGFDNELVLDSAKERTAAAASMVKSKEDVEQERRALQAAIATLERPTEDAVEEVRDTIWYRRVAYFLTLGLTFLLAAYPFTKNLFAWTVETGLRATPVIGDGLVRQYEEFLARADEASTNAAALLVNALSGALPRQLSPWTEALTEHPIEFLALVCGVLWCLYLGKVLQARIADRAHLAWHHRSLGSHLAWLADRYKAARNLTLVCSLLAIAGAVTVSNPLTRIELSVLGAIFSGLFLWRASQVRSSGRWKRNKGKDVPGGNTPVALRLARFLRRDRITVTTYRAVANYLIPGMFAAGLLLGGFYLANHAVYDVFAAAGYFCEGSRQQSAAERLGSADGFDTRNMCWNSHLVVRKGERYRITLTVREPWSDRENATGVEGVPSDGLHYLAGEATRPWWGRNWFQPIARIGAFGNDEYPLEPDPANRAPSRLIADITSRKTGELFLYVNDAVVMMPGLVRHFYESNRGTASIEVRRLAPESP